MPPLKKESDTFSLRFIKQAYLAASFGSIYSLDHRQDDTCCTPLLFVSLHKQRPFVGFVKTYTNIGF